MSDGRRVLITRAQPGANSTARRLKAVGMTPVVMPLLQLRPLALSRAHQDLVAGFTGDVIFTSANGVRFAPISLTQRVGAAWCVGDATAEAARRAGFETIRSAGGSARELIDLIMSERDPRDARFMHLGHAEPRGSIAETLAEHGFDVVHIPLYGAAPTPDYATRLSAAFSGDVRIDAVMIHSPASGQRFADIWRRHGLDGVDPPLIAAISNAAADPLRELAGDRIKVARAPTEAAMIDLIETG